MTKMKYIKACPFLRDFSDSYLCVNDDKVADVVLDPLRDVEWTDIIEPVASQCDDIETCLFTLEIKEDGRLYCLSRNMFLSMDKREILWNDIRDAFFLMNLNDESNIKESDIDFCSTCLYKVLLASSPTFQTKLSFDQKLKLGSSYIINKANEIFYSLNELSNSFSVKKSLDEIQKGQSSDNSNIASFSWMLWLTNNVRFDDEFISYSINWFQKFDEWGVMISKIGEEETEEKKIRLIEQSQDYAIQLKDISYQMVAKMTNVKEKEFDIALKNTEKIFIIASVLFEDYIFICSQFLDLIKNNENEKNSD